VGGINYRPFVYPEILHLEGKDTLEEGFIVPNSE
jgi:hypothetical protein